MGMKSPSIAVSIPGGPIAPRGSAKKHLVLTSITFQCGKDIDLLLCISAAFCLDLCRVKDEINCLFSHRAPPGPGFSPPVDILGHAGQTFALRGCRRRSPGMVQNRPRAWFTPGSCLTGAQGVLPVVQQR